MTGKLSTGILWVLAIAAFATGRQQPVDLEFRLHNDWGAGMVGEFLLVNHGPAPVKDWTLEFEFPSAIGNIWGARIAHKEGALYTLEPEPWAKTIAAEGGRVTIGFQATPGDVPPPRQVRFRPVVAGPPLPGPRESGTDAAPRIDTQFTGGPDRDWLEGDAEISFRVVSDWGSGFQGEIAIFNKGTKPLENWRIEMDLPQTRLSGLWNARIASIEGSKLTIDAAPYEWNRDIAPGGSARFGFLGSPGGLLTPPTAMALRARPALAVVIPFPTPPVEPPAVPEKPVAREKPNYAAALQSALFFYDAQRSGPLPDDFRVRWRGPSGLRDGLGAGVDLTGGFYDAGDGMKFALPMASSMTLLAWAGIEFGAGFEEAGQSGYLHETIRWGTDWLLRAFVADDVFYVQVGRPDLDHAFWGPPERMNMPRPVFRVDKDHPGTDVAAEAAAALAAASLLFRDRDPRHAAHCLDAAIRLFAFADRYRGKYSDSVPEARAHYPSGRTYEDDLAWAAAWLYRATGKKTYLQQAEKLLAKLVAETALVGTHSWADKLYGALVLMADLTKQRRYRHLVQRWLDFWAAGPGGNGIATTPGRLAWKDQWGSLRYAANTAFLALVYAANFPDPGDRYAGFARRQIDYILGDNPAGRSYLVGFGQNFPRNPHHRAAHASSSGNIRNPKENRHILYGALVGGPSAPDDFAYSDDRENYVSNEVALDYNAGLTGALARLTMEFGGSPDEDFPPPTAPD